MFKIPDIASYSLVHQCGTA